MINKEKQTTIPLQTEANARYTADQWAAIHLEGDNLLVSASAGSGKTSVLVQRILRKVRRGYGVDELLVVTFTEKAASEMKERLESALQEMINDEPDSDSRQHYLQQIAKLPQANISTIDAFCKQVIQRYYFLIDLDPVYRLLTDETENMMHFENVWETLKEDLLANENADYLLMANHFASDRKDDKVDQLIFDLYNKSRVHTDPNEWLDGLVANYPDADTPYGETSFYQDFVVPTLLAEIEALENTVRLYIEDLPVSEAIGFEKMASSVKEKLAYLDQLKTNIKSSYKEAYQQVISMPFPRLVSQSKKDFEAGNDAQIELRTTLKERHDKTIKAVFEKDIMPYFTFDEHYQGQFIQDAKRLAQAIINIEKKFTKRMQAHKFDQRILDFSDIELFTYQILSKQVGELSQIDTDQPEVMNEAKAYYRDKFTEVMIDEYQDVNALQEAILQAVSGNPDQPNMFMVGDVKQSIYRFRFAEPGLFIHKYNQFADGNGGKRIVLAENFRSRADVLDFTNFIFRQVMDPQVGQIAYDEEAALKLGFTDYPETDRMQTEILLYEEEKASNLENDLLDEGINNGTKMQAELIAQSILDKVHHQHMIYDKKIQAERPITFNDIVILVATRRNHSELEDVFAQYKIPLMLDDSANYFQRTEIRIMLNVLKFIDNPYQDIPLAAILRSPIIGLNEQDLAKIRIANQKATYYDAMKAYMIMDEGQDAQLAEKLHKLNAWHQDWRDIARDKPLATLIWRIYTDTGFLDYVAGMPNGEVRQNNLHGFYQLASDYEASAFKGIFQFIRFVEKIQEKDNDLQAPKHGDDTQSAVKVFTIHHSKGLEFPLVYVYNVSKRFNTQDLRNPVIYNDVIGMGVKLTDRSRHITYPNMFEMMTKRFEKKDMLAEEMRKLYVALTRAEQQLVLVGMVKDFDAVIAKWQGLLMKDEQLAPSGRIKANSLLDWIGPALMRHHDFDQVNQSVHIPDYLTNTNTNFRIAVVSGEEALLGRHKWINAIDETAPIDHNEILAAILADDKIVENDQVDKQMIQLPVSQLDYAYQSATQTTSFQSVSELKRMLQDPSEQELKPWSINNRNKLTKTFRYTEDDYEQPKFLVKDQPVTPTAIGSAAHLLMQKLPLDDLPNTDTFKSLFNTLCDAGILSQQLWDHIQVDKLIAFFETATGQLILRHADHLYREETFSLMMAGSEIFTDMSTSDDLLIHGTIDGFILLADEIYLYDFKTDRIAYLNDSQQEKTLVDRYQAQMDLYAQALETIWGKPVTQKMIISLDTLKTFFV